MSRIYVKKPTNRPMSEQTRLAYAHKSKVRSAIEHVSAREKGLMGLVVRTIGIARAETKIGFTNLAYIMRPYVWLEAKHVVASA